MTVKPDLRDCLAESKNDISLLLRDICLIGIDNFITLNAQIIAKRQSKLNHKFIDETKKSKRCKLFRNHLKGVVN
jgi:hypothetical protein